MSGEGRRQSSRHAIGNIAGDNIAGAAELLLRGVEVYALLSAEQRKRECSSAEHAVRRIVQASIALLQAQPGMAPLARLASAAVEAAAQSNNAVDALARAETAARSFAQRAEHASRAAAEHAAKLIHDGSRVLTHSRSSTVLLAFKLALAEGHRCDVIATESRPMMEGRMLAAALVEEGARVMLIADADAAGGIEQADIVLLGADAVTPSRVINKIGSRLIGLAARELEVPAYVVCDTSKFIGASETPFHARRRQDSAELWPNAPDGVEVHNTYFEAAPLSLFAAVITEHGLTTPEEASSLAERFVLSDRLSKGL